MLLPRKILHRYFLVHHNINRLGIELQRYEISRWSVSAASVEFLQVEGSLAVGLEGFLGGLCFAGGLQRSR